MLQITGLNKSYGSQHALIDFSVTLPSGIYGLLGANGAGKSTLMRIIAGNLHADSGELQFDGQSNIRHILGYMPQQQALYDDFSARDFLYYMAGLKGIKSARREVERLLEVVNLKEEAHRKLRTYSGGMKQRALLAQALLGKPKLLLLDEPTAGLDPLERIRIRNFISEVASDKVVLLATHVVSDIEFISNRVLMMRNGVLLGDKPSEQWLDEMQDKVFEITTSDEQLPFLKTQYRISNLMRYGSGLVVRVLSDTPPDNAVAARPTLEDVYLYAQGC